MTSTQATASDVRLERVVKRFDETIAVDGISFEILGERDVVGLPPYKRDVNAMLRATRSSRT